jgi:hypothetical protein
LVGLSRARRLAALFALLLPALAAHATNYTFPGSLPAGCSGSGGNYTCPSGLTLTGGDTITIASPKPATITITGGFTTNQGSTVGNANPADLTLIISGNLNVGTSTVVNASITAGSVTINSNTTDFTAVNGDIISTGSGASGLVSIGQYSNVNGDITSTSANVTLNTNVTVTGSVSTAGTITIGQSAFITGSVTGTSGTIQLNNLANVGGAITVTSGAITLAQSAIASSCVKASTTGTITLNNQAVAAGVCCGGSCTSSCVSNGSGSAMPPVCTSLATTTIAIDNDSSIEIAGKDKTTSATWLHTVGAGTNRILVVGISLADTTSPTSVTYGGAALTSLGGGSAGSANRTEIWYKLAPTVGLATLAVNFAAAKPVIAGAVSFTGVQQSAPTATFNSSSAGSTTASVTVTSIAGQMIFDAVTAESAATSITNSTQRQHWNLCPDPCGPAEVYSGGATKASSSTSVTSSWTLGVSKAWSIGSLSLQPASAAVDHYETSLPSASLACLASTVTITACADTSSPCTSASTTVSGSTATLAASAGSLAATSVSFNASGVASTTLSYSGAANGATSTVTLSGESTVATNSRKCCPNGSSCSVANSCSSTFSTAGFVIASSAGGASTTLPTQTAGTASSSYVLRAVKTGTSTQACQAAITGSTTVNWAYQCNNPTTCSTGNRMVLTGNSATTIAANPNSGVSSYLSVPMTFDSNGNAPFSFNYSDVGQVTLYATKAASGSLLTSLSGNSNAFVVKPAGFVLSGIKCSSYTAGACATSAIATPGNNPAAASAAGTAFIPAGQAFSATVTAVDSTSAAVPNFGKETSAEGVTLTPALVLPAGGNAGTLANPAAFGSFSSGVATGTSFSYSEVGIITLTPSLASGSYLGTGSAVTGTTTGNVGRFIPNHFTTAVTPGCSGSFTYSGQPLTASVTAKNAAGTTVQNYASSTGFSKAVTLSDGASLGTGSLTGNGIAATAFSAGVASATPTYTYTSKLTSPATLIVRAADADGVGSSGYTEGSGLLRSGRLRLSNGYGRETASLQLALQAEYWTGTSWLLNSSDSCTSIPAAAVAFSNKRNNIGAGTSAWSTTASGTSLAAGSGLLTLSAPSPTATGAIDIALNLGSTTADQSCLSTHPASTGAGLAWLRSQNGNCVTTYDRDPSGRASFGIYTPESKKTVHVRELF